MIYLDNAATTKLDDRVLMAMQPYWRQEYGNPSSQHLLGQAARSALSRSRRQVANLLGCDPSEIIFTSGATEANNLVIRGVAEAQEEAGQHIVISALEHPSVVEPVEALEAMGWQVSVVGVDRRGRVEPTAVATEVRSDTMLVSIVMINNEIGAIQPIQAIASAVKQRNPKVVVHTDAVQAFGYQDCKVEDLGVDALTISGHKIHGPKGVGGLYLKKDTPLLPQLTGGPQEHNLRAGTEAVPLIVGLGRASELVAEEGAERAERVDGWRLLLKKLLTKKFPSLVKVLTEDDASPHILGVIIPGVDREALLARLDRAGLAISVGSACTSGDLEPSSVVLALGYGDAEARSFLRFSLSKDNTEKEIKEAVKILQRCLEGMKIRRRQQA